MHAARQWLAWLGFLGIDPRVRRRGRWFLLLPATVVLGLLFWGEVARAASDLVLVVGSKDDAVVERLMSELALLGYRGEVVSGSRRQWAREAEDRQAVAVVEVREGGVVLWPAPVTRRERPEAGYPVDGEDHRVLALRAAELLHGQLASPTEGGDSGRGSVPVHGADPAAAGSRSAAPLGAPVSGSGLGLLGGPALFLVSGGIPPTLGARVHALWRPVPWMEAGAVALFPVSGASLVVSGGEAEVRVRAFGVGAQLRWVSSAVAIGVGPELLAHRSTYDVTLEAAAFDDTSAARWSPRAGMGLSLAWRPHRFIGVRGDAMIDAVHRPLEVMDPANRSAVQQARREAVAQIGNPVVSLSAGVEIELPLPSP